MAHSDKSEGIPESTDLVKHQAQTDVMAIGMDHGVVLTSFDQMVRLGQYIEKSGFAPKGMDLFAIVVAMEMGQEVGLPPMQAIQNIAVINGKPSVYGDVGKALVISSPLCESIREWFDGEEPTDAKGEFPDNFAACCEVLRRGSKEPVVTRFSVADAKRAKLWMKTGNQGQDTPWVTYPKRMLKFRARGFALRDEFPDVLKGLVLAEEARDYIDVRPVVETYEPPAPAVTEAFDKAGFLVGKRKAFLGMAKKEGLTDEELIARVLAEVPEVHIEDDESEPDEAEASPKDDPEGPDGEAVKEERREPDEPGEPGLGETF